MYALGVMTEYNIAIAIGIPSNAHEITVPGFSRPIQVGDVWASLYCVP